MKYKFSDEPVESAVSKSLFHYVYFLALMQNFGATIDTCHKYLYIFSAIPRLFRAGGQC